MEQLLISSYQLFKGNKQNIYISIYFQMLIFNALKKLDLSHVQYIPKLKENQKYHKTAFGGCITLIVYSLSLAYLIYIIYIWNDGQILPKVTTKTELLHFANFTFQQSIIEISNSNKMDLFSKQKNYLMPVTTITESTSTNMTFDRKITFQNNQKLLMFENMNLIRNIAHGITKYLIIALVPCNQTQLPEDSFCEDQQKIKDLLSTQTIYINLTIALKQFNQKLKDFEVIPKEIILILDTSQTTYVQVQLKPAEIEVDDGFLFSSSNKNTEISSANTITQNVNLSYLRGQFDGDPYFLFLISLDSLQDQMVISYPKIGEILAQVNSIFSVLMILQYLQVYFNEYSLQQLFQQELLQIYFPELKSFKIKQDYLNRIVSVSKDDQEFDIQTYQKFRLENFNRIKEKLNILNQIYELSRIEHLIFSLVPRALIVRNRKVGFKMNLKKSNIINKIHLQKILPENEKDNERIDFSKNVSERQDSKMQNTGSNALKSILPNIINEEMLLLQPIDCELFNRNSLSQVEDEEIHENFLRCQLFVEKNKCE